MPDPPRTADLKARIIAQMNRDGFSLITYQELRSAWPEEFGTVMQFSLLANIAAEEQWKFEFLPEGVRFSPATEE